MRKRIAELIDLIYGFRKFIAFLLLLVVSIVFRLNNQIDGVQFVDLLKNVSLAFFAANGVEHFTDMAKGYLNKIPETTNKPPAGVPNAQPK